MEELSEMVSWHHTEPADFTVFLARLGRKSVGNHRAVGSRNESSSRTHLHLQQTGDPEPTGT